MPIETDLHRKGTKVWQVCSDLTSDSDATATPPTIGNKESSTSAVGLSFKNNADSTTEKNGSIACITTMTTEIESVRHFDRVGKGDSHSTQTDVGERVS